MGENAYLVRATVGSCKAEDDYKIIEVPVEKTSGKYVNICRRGIFVSQNGCDFLRPKNLYSIGCQLFPTREAAEKGIERMKIIQHIRDYVNEIGALVDTPIDDLREICKILGGGCEEG